MKDITVAPIGEDMHVADTQAYKAMNILDTQLGSLEYLKEFGIDLEYFLQPDYEFENSSFKAYLIERLTNQGINVAQLIDLVQTFYHKYVFYTGGDTNNTSLIAR